MQVKTNTTVPVEEALEEIKGEPKGIRVDSGETVLFIRMAADDDRRDGFLVSAVVPLIDERKTIVVEDERTITEAIAGAETARVVRINETPWSPLYEDG